jgi:hypothetical protein
MAPPNTDVGSQYLDGKKGTLPGLFNFLVGCGGPQEGLDIIISLYIGGKGGPLMTGIRAMNEILKWDHLPWVKAMRKGP